MNGPRALMTKLRTRCVRWMLSGLAAAFVLTACTGGGEGESRSESLGLAQAPADLAELRGAIWVADDIQDTEVSIVPGTQVEMKFRKNGLSVNAGCNQLFGDASIDGDELVIVDLASSAMACDNDLTQQDEWLSDFLSSRPTFEVLEQEMWLSQGDDTVIHLVQE